MFNFNKNKKSIDTSIKSREESIARGITIAIAKKYGASINLIMQGKDTYLYVEAHKNKFDLVLTVCDTNKHKVIKIEELLVNEKLRNKGLGTEIIKTIQNICDEEKCIVGLWCEVNNKKMFNWYSRLGFKYIETLDDDWLEYGTE